MYNKYIKYKNKYIKHNKLQGGAVGVNSKKSWFILSCGPTGSGKSNVLTKFTDLWNKTYPNDSKIFKELLVDNLVENDPDYQVKLNQISKEYNISEIVEQLSTLDLSDDSINKYMEDENSEMKTIKDIIKKYSDAYFSIRDKSCLNQCKLYDKLLLTPCNCNILNDLNLYSSLVNKDNIIMESTCSNDITWIFNLFSNPYIKEFYELHIVFVFVNKTELKRRIINRYTESKLRLPDFINIDKLYNQIISKFNYLKKSKESKDSQNNFELHVIDNNYRPSIEYFNIKNSDNIDINKLTGIHLN